MLDRVTLRWFSRDLNSRGVLVANALSDSVADALTWNRLSRLRALFERAAQDERLFAIGLCSPEGRLLQLTDRYPKSLTCAVAVEVAGQVDPRLALPGGPVHVGVQDVMGIRPPEPAAPSSPAALVPGEPDVSVLEPASLGEVASAPLLLGRLVLLHDLSLSIGAARTPGAT